MGISSIENGWTDNWRNVCNNALLCHLFLCTFSKYMIHQLIIPMLLFSRRPNVTWHQLSKYGHVQHVELLWQRPGWAHDGLLEAGGGKSQRAPQSAVHHCLPGELNTVCMCTCHSPWPLCTNFLLSAYCCFRPVDAQHDCVFLTIRTSRAMALVP